MNDFTFITGEDVFGDDEQALEIFKVAGTESPLTDYSIILGAYYDPESKLNYGPYWTKSTVSSDKNVIIVDEEGYSATYSISLRDKGARVVYNLPENIEKELTKNLDTTTEHIFQVKYGYYPQSALNGLEQEKLDNMLKQGKLQLTNNYYTADSRKEFEYDEIFAPITFKEYKLEDKRLIKAVANTAQYNGVKSKYKNGDSIWVNVEPVYWLLDTKRHQMISGKLLFAGVQFADNSNFTKFEETRIYQFLNTCFARELTQGLSEELLPIKDSIKDTKFSSSYNFDFSKVSEEDIIKGAIQSNVSVFLHGRSSDGKSSRVKQLDPDCTIIYLRNATPDSLNGKSVYNASTGEMLDVPPTWYKKLQEKCEKEPNKLHIVFFDELTNALPSIQGMAFNIILDGEVNGIWKLPENARIVAAGNDLDDSLAANAMAEPLFNRFAHIYINTTTDDWLKWAITPAKNYEQLHYQKRETSSKIHPTIYAYIAYKNAVGMNVLRTHYDGKSPNADPRKWEMASKVLYATRKPEMLRSLIGEYLTRDFIDFCTQKVISIEDVLTGNYTEDDLQMSPSKKYATIVNLSLVDEENIETIRTFISKLDNELLATFDLLWTNGNEERLEKIQELKLEKLLNKK